MKGCSAGGSRNSSSYGSNPKFWLKVCDGGEVLASLLQHQKWRNTEKYVQMPLEVSKNTKHQHHQAIALHMWKVCAAIFKKKYMLVCVILLLFIFVLTVFRWKRSVLT